jgi:O-antigen ligase
MTDLADTGPLAAQRIAPNPRRNWIARLVVLLLGAEGAIYLGIALAYGMLSDVAQRLVAGVGLSTYFIVTVASPLAGILMWLVLYPFAETTLNLSLGGSIPDLSPTRLMAGFLACMLLAQAAIRKRPLPKLTALDWWGLLFIGGIGLSAVATPNLIASFKSVLDMFLMPLVLYFLVKHFITGRREIEWLFNALLLIGVYSSVLAIHEQLTGVIWFSTEDYTLNSYATGIHILRSLWGTNAVYGSIFALVIPIALYRFIESRTAGGKLSYAALNGIFLISMFFTYKRAAWIAMLISFVILFVLYPAIRRTLLIGLVIFAIPVAVFWNRIVASSLVEERVTANAASLNGRTDRWQVAIQLWGQKPIFGVGFSQFDALSGFLAIENTYLHVLVSGGLVAFLPFLVFWVLVVRDGIELFIRGPSLPGVFVTRPIMAVFLAVIATYLIKGLTGIHTTPINLIFYVLVGGVLGSQAEARRQYRKGYIQPQVAEPSRLAGSAPAVGAAAPWEPAA